MSEGGGKMNRDAPATVAATGEPLPANYYYGTFQGVANYQTPSSQSQPVFGFPQPIPPPGVSVVLPCYYPHGYQTVQGYAVAEGRPMREHRLPCCGMGIGWFLSSLLPNSVTKFSLREKMRSDVRSLGNKKANAHRSSLLVSFLVPFPGTLELFFFCVLGSITEKNLDLLHAP